MIAYCSYGASELEWGLYETSDADVLSVANENMVLERQFSSNTQFCIHTDQLLVISQYK